MRIAVAATLTLASIASVLAQAGPTFDVVSIKRNTGGVGPGNTAPPVLRPDGSLTLKNVPVNTLIARAYPDTDIVGLPDWVRTERFDIATTSTLTTATADERIAMLRAMLADRFHLTVHIEQRDQQVFDLVLARKDGSATCWRATRRWTGWPMRFASRPGAWWSTRPACRGAIGSR